MAQHSPLTGMKPDVASSRFCAPGRVANATDGHEFERVLSLSQTLRERETAAQKRNSWTFTVRSKGGVIRRCCECHLRIQPQLAAKLALSWPSARGRCGNTFLTVRPRTSGKDVLSVVLFLSGSSHASFLAVSISRVRCKTCSFLVLSLLARPPRKDLLDCETPPQRKVIHPFWFSSLLIGPARKEIHVFPGCFFVEPPRKVSSRARSVHRSAPNDPVLRKVVHLMGFQMTVRVPRPAEPIFAAEHQGTAVPHHPRLPCLTPPIDRRNEKTRPSHLKTQIARHRWRYHQRDSSEPRERCRHQLHDSLPLAARCRRHPIFSEMQPTVVEAELWSLLQWR